MFSRARLGCALLFLASAAGLLAQGRFAVLNKHRAFQQTGTTTTAAHPTTPFAFSASIEGTATNPAAPNSVTLPNGGATRALTYSVQDEEWLIEQEFPSQAALNTAYPNGTYTFTIGGRNASVALTGDQYPNAPVATLSQGTFNANGTLSFDRTQPLTITISFGAGFVAGRSRLAIEIDGAGIERDASTEASGFTQSQLSLVLPANTVPAGAQLSIQLEANQILGLDTTSVTGFTVAGVYSTHTEITAMASGGGGPVPGAPQIVSDPISHTVSPNSTVVLSVVATGAASFEWRRNGVAVPFGGGPTLVLGGANLVAGNYTVVARNANGPTESRPAQITVQAGPDVGRLVNLAIRSNAGTGAQTLIVGFAVGGAGTSGEKPLLVRGVGPSLAQFNLTGVLADPVATMFQGSTTVAANDDWAGNAQVAARATQVAAFGLTSTASLDAALAASPTPGSYSVQITGKNNGTGIALAEIYDASAQATAGMPRLVNVSARTQVGTGSDVLIAGFVVGGTTSRTVLIRAIGPGLTPFGVTGTIADPRLQLFTGTTLMRENDNWNGEQLLVNMGNNVGAFEIADRQSRDAMLVVTLPPGSYTAQVSGVNSGTGVALVEVYEVP